MIGFKLDWHSIALKSTKIMSLLLVLINHQTQCWPMAQLSNPFTWVHSLFGVFHPLMDGNLTSLRLKKKIHLIYKLYVYIYIYMHIHLYL